MPATPCFVYMTAASADEASAIADALVDERLAACVNLIPGMRSVYRWEGVVQHDEEVVLIAKTMTDRIEALTDRVKAIHSYSCPCVVALRLEGGNGAFLQWIEEQVNTYIQ